MTAATPAPRRPAGSTAAALDQVHDPCLEEAVDALEEGDRPLRPGTARAALAHPLFRRVFLGAFLSNIGTWMQNVVLGALAYDLTGSATVVGLLVLAQLGPQLALSVVGGMLADAVDRRRLLMAVAATQGLLAAALAWVARTPDPSIGVLVVLTLCIGTGQAIFAPVYSALLPALVGRDDLPGAISLNSAQMNGSRVVGPAIGSLLDARFGAGAVFGLNALSYLFVVGSLWPVALPAAVVDPAQRGVARLLGGFRVARADPVVGRCLRIIVTFSLCSLPFIGQLPVLAERNLGIDARSTSYGALYTCFGFGAMAGALSIGTVLAGRSLTRMVKGGLLAFAVMLALLGALRQAAPAYPVIAVTGFWYFAVVTSLSTLLQQRLDDTTRGRVMALWIMGFGGTVPIGNMLAGPLIDATSVTVVLGLGALAAAVLGLRARFDDAAPLGPLGAA